MPLHKRVDKDTEAPPIDIIKMAVQMMNAHGAPAFLTKREKRLATVELARQLWKSAVAVDPITPR
jgi:hypothetical protein